MKQNRDTDVGAAWFPLLVIIVSCSNKRGSLVTMMNLKNSFFKELLILSPFVHA